MEISELHYQKIAHCLPVQRGNVSLSNLDVLNAILYVAEHGCKWRGLPPHFGNWHTVYTCQVPYEYLPRKSYALFEARSILRDIFGTA